jgi:hypothetical protein
MGTLLGIELLPAATHSPARSGRLEPCVGSFPNQSTVEFCQRPEDVEDQLPGARIGVDYFL